MPRRLTPLLISLALVACQTSTSQPTVPKVAATVATAPSPTVAAPRPSPTALPTALPTVLVKPAPTATSKPAAPPPTKPAPAPAQKASPVGAPATPTPPRVTAVRIGTGPAQQVAAAPTGNAVFAATADGLYRLGGAAPEQVSRGSVPPNLLALDEKRLIGGAGQACMRGGGGSSLRFSVDGGKTWQEASGPGGQPVEATPAAARGNSVFAVTCAGTIWSSDGGKSFKLVASLSPENHDPQAVALTPDGKFAFVAAVSEGGSLVVMRSERLGSGWGTPATIDRGWGGAALGVGPENRLYLGTATGVRVSTDLGRNWRPIGKGLESVLLAGDPTRGPLSDADVAKLRTGAGVNDFAFSGQAVFAATSEGIFSRAGDQDWRRLPDVTEKVTDLDIATGALYATTPNGVVRVSLP